MAEPTGRRPLTPDDRAALDRILDEALSLPPDRWEPLVAARFGNRPELIAEARSLLEHARAAPTLFPSPEDLALPTRAGVYRLIRELGRGGMGVVFLAERDDGRFEQRVAIKLLPPTWGLPGSSRRFDAECRILARLEHPRICRILDSGRTPEGWPFLAMELVDGQTLDRWCAVAAPAESEKLAVFLQVCEAVQYAHSNLVIHRDLKPQNVIITAAGAAKLLDFGVAKLMSDDDGGAPPTVPMLTPKYGSPEQRRGEPATTASDIYSAGVVLRELIGPQASADLRAVAEKAAASEPADRYGSMAQVAEDIARYLQGAPVLAQRQTFSYVVSRLLRRYRPQAMAAAAAMVLAAIAVAAVLWEARVAARERARAVQHFTNIRRLAGSLVFDLHDRIEKVPGALDAREALLQRGSEYLDILAADAGSDATILIEVSQAYRRLSALQFEPSLPTRLDLEGALSTLGKAEAVARQAVRAAPRDLAARLELVRVLVQLVSRSATRASWHNAQGAEVRRRRAEEALDLARTLVKERSADADVMRELAAAQFALAAINESLDIRRSVEGYREALMTSRQGLARKPDDPLQLESVARTSRALGVAVMTAGDLDGADEALQAALALDERLLANEPRNSRRALSVTYDLSSLFTASGRKGNWDAALAFASRSAQMREEILRRDPSDQNARLRLWFTRTNGTAEALLKLNRPADALVDIMRGREMESALPRGSIPAGWLARARYNEGRAHELLGRNAAACPLWRESADLFGSAPPVAGTEQLRRDTQNGLARCGASAVRRRPH